MKNLAFHKRLKFAFSGLLSAFQMEASFKFQSLAALTVFIFLIGLQPSPIWWALLILTVAAVLTAELLNTALEQLIDRVHPDLHESIRIAKDCAAGAVLIASCASLAVFVAFLFEYRSRFGFF